MTSKAREPHYRLRELADRVGGEVRGSGDVELRGVATLAGAGPADVSFLANPGYRSHLPATRAGAVILAPADAGACPCPALVTDRPYVAYARIAGLFHPPPQPDAGVHASAVVAESARVAPSAAIGAQAVIGERVSIGDGAVIGAGSVVEADTHIGAGTRLAPRVTICRGVRLGERVLVHPGAVIGADGFGLAQDGGAWVKVPQVGGVRVDDDCEIGANTTVDRGALDDTVLEADVRLDNQVQIAHNVVVGAHTAMAGCAAVAGSARLGRYCMVGGGAGILGHVEVADRVVIGAMALVTRSITAAGEYASGTPLQRRHEWRKSAARFRQLDELARRLRRIEKGD